MSTGTLQRTVRRCTAVLVAVLGAGFDGVATGLDGTLLVLGALAYLLVSGFVGLADRYDERVGLTDDAVDSSGEEESDDGAPSGERTSSS